MRIIAGQNKGKKLTTLPGNQTRPTSDRVREALFNILRARVANARILDLFAGSGALGLEALSRGARQVTFIDSSPDALEILRQNVNACRRNTQIEIRQWDIEHNLSCLKPREGNYDLVFMDPPYGRQLIQPALAHLHASHALQKDAWVVAEHDRHESLVLERTPFGLTDQRRYGKTHISIWEYRIPGNRSAQKINTTTTS